MKIKFGVYIVWRKGPLEAVKQGLLAEKYGFDSVWFPDHFIDMRVDIEFAETWTVLSYIGAQTRRIKLASGVTDPLRRHPATIAQIVATLDRLSNGRAILGLGAGEKMNLLPFGIRWDKPLTRLVEAIEVITRLWKATPKKPANFNGHFYNLKNAFIQVSPIQYPRPPIYIGALSSRTRRLVGEIADGWFPWINSVESYSKRLEEIKSGAKKAGRSIDEIDRVVVLDVAISGDKDAARKAVEESAKSALILEREVLSQLGYGDLLPPNLSIQRTLFTEKYTDILKEAIKKVPDEAVDSICAFGTVNDCIEKIDSFIRAGATNVVISNQGPNVAKTAQAFKEKIIPYFKNM